jgi:hypothetical protein
MKSFWTDDGKVKFYFRFLVTSTILIFTEMKVFVTNPSIPKHNFITAASHLPQNFQITFSIRIESGAHLFLCENDDLTNASCYWFQLRHKNKKTSVVKCFDVNLLSSIVNELLPHQHYNCSKNLNEKRVK